MICSSARRLVTYSLIVHACGIQSRDLVPHLFSAPKEPPAAVLVIPIRSVADHDTHATVVFFAHEYTYRGVVSGEVRSGPLGLE